MKGDALILNIVVCCKPTHLLTQLLLSLLCVHFWWMDMLLTSSFVSGLFFLYSNMILKTGPQTIWQNAQPSCQTLPSYLFYFWSLPAHNYLFWWVKSFRVTGQRIAMQLPPDKAGVKIDCVEKTLLTAIFRKRLCKLPVRAERFPLFSHSMSWQSLLLTSETPQDLPHHACGRWWLGCRLGSGQVVLGGRPCRAERWTCFQ